MVGQGRLGALAVVVGLLVGVALQGAHDRRRAGRIEAPGLAGL
jgi:hypothetical protein